MSNVFVIDTNVLLRFLHDDDKEQHELVTPYFLNANNQLIIPIQALCETVWV